LEDSDLTWQAKFRAACPSLLVQRSPCIVWLQFGWLFSSWFWLLDVFTSHT